MKTLLNALPAFPQTPEDRNKGQMHAELILETTSCKIIAQE